MKGKPKGHKFNAKCTKKSQGSQKRKGIHSPSLLQLTLGEHMDVNSKYL